MAERTPVFPSRHVPLPRDGGPAWLHALELATCLALGQRALIVGPPGSGKSTVLREVGLSIAHHAPHATIDVVIIDQRVEEQMEWRASLPSARLHATASDASPAEHVAVVEAMVDAERRAAAGGDAVVLVDSLAALARALNATHEDSDRVLTGGLLATALRDTRLRFGAGRALEPDGSLTVVATAAIDTGSELDDVVFHELVGTGNMDVRLSPEALAAGLFPPLDVASSGARHEAGVLGTDEADARADLRAEVARHGPAAGLALLLAELDRAGSLAALLQERRRLADG